MRIRTISTGQLRRMGDQEGLVLQGCGGDLQEWVDGINEILAQEGILKKGAGFEEAYTFRHDGLTCMLFPFKENMELDMGKLAIWRLASYSTFGGTWLSDYVPNRLGGFIQEQKTAPERIKPDCPLIGEDGNIFRIMGIASETLRENGMQEQAEEMRSRIFQCQSYDSALSIIGDYVNITVKEQAEELSMDEEPLQWAIMTAINSVMDSKETICRQITEAAVEETGILPDSTMTLGEINRRLEELEAEFNILLQQPDSAVKNAARFGSIANEMASLKEQREKVAARLRKDQTVQLHVHTMKAALDGMSHHMQQWDEEMVRQLVHTVKVISADHIKVFLYDGTEIDQTVGHGNSIID